MSYFFMISLFFLFWLTPTLSPSLFLFILCFLILSKILLSSNHLLMILLSIETLSILTIYVFMQNNQTLFFSTATPMSLFTFLVITAAMGVALLINQTRQISRQALRLLSHKL